MHAFRGIGVLALLLPALAACAGGSGSSGFDITAALENAVVERVLSDDECDALGDLTVCPADPPADSGPDEPAPPARDPGVVTSFGAAAGVECAPSTNGDCETVVFFAPSGFPSGAALRVAVRDPEDEKGWQLGGEPSRFSDGEPPLFESVVTAPLGADSLQLAVLVFLDPASVPQQATFETLSSAGADFAFVTSPAPLGAG